MLQMNNLTPRGEITCLKVTQRARREKKKFFFFSKQADRIFHMLIKKNQDHQIREK